jgi:K+-sensing histidine kinase KdpD
VNSAIASTPFTHVRGRPGVGQRRRALGLLLAVVALTTVTVLLEHWRGGLSLASVLLVYVLVVVAVSTVGGMVDGVASAVASFALANFFLTPPYRTFLVEGRDSVVALSVFLAVAVVVSVLVDVAASQRARAARTEAEAEVLGRVAAEPISERTAEQVLTQLATAFAQTSVELRGPDQTVLARVGPAITGSGSLRVAVGGGREVVGSGRALFAEDRRLLGALAQAASAAVDAEALADQAARARELAEVDRLRAALLAAVSHDLRTPLAGIKASVTTLRQDVVLSEADRNELLATVEDGADRLSDLVADLLDMGRLQASAVTLELQAVPVDEVVSRALLERHLGDVRNEIPDDLPYVRADAALLERVVANLAENAHRHAGAGVVIRGSRSRQGVEVVVQDHGPGVAPADYERMFLPFQRLGERTTGTHVGLGLSIARGFTEAMGGTLTPSATAGGGLTMTVRLPLSEPSSESGRRP